MRLRQSIGLGLGLGLSTGGGVADQLICCIPAQQAAGSGVPLDVSGKGNNLVKKAGISDAQLWANAGFMSSIAASDGYAYLANAAFAFTMGTDSFVFSMVINEAAPGGDQSFIGCANANTRPGFYIQRRASGLIRVATTVAGANVIGPDVPGAFFDNTAHHLVVGIDGPTRSTFVWRDGVIAQSRIGVIAAGTGAVSGNFAFGTNLDTGAAGTSFAAKFAGIQMLKFANDQLPNNINAIAARLAASPYTPLTRADMAA